ncbi:MAG: penicillin-binding protein 1C [Rhodobacteraceae bacterium]|nr:penicillin-binding protein 1C [Paracoccaceae bacterium]
MALAALIVLDDWVARTGLPSLELETAVTVLDRNGDLLRAYTVESGRWRLPVALADVDPHYVDMLVAFEDKRFYSHMGVDPLALLRGFRQFVFNGRIVSGGSTITMQVARLLERGETGRWGGKLRQIRVALALERRLSKAEVLELYVQLAPMGGNIEGVRAATLTYFGKEPRRLTPAEAALLIALPQAPSSRRPDRYAAAAQIARDRVLDRAVLAEMLPADEAQAGKRANVPSTRISFPILAPHFTDALRAAQPERRLFETTLDRSLQQGLEALLFDAMETRENGLSAALVLAEHQSGDILATVGAADLFDARADGYVDMTRAVRSPGSTLKLLIYGIGFENGLATPETMIDDRPMRFRGYEPQNFDRQFRGTVSIRTALQLSLNIPAVAMMDAIGPAQFLARLRRAGLEPKLPKGGAPGLAIALGGIGLSLQDLVQLYAGIARGGVPVVLSGLGGEAGGNPLLLPGAAWQVSDILAATPPPETGAIGQIAYKTGTSYGYRDAFAIGFDGRFVMGVWMGRPDGASVPGLQGIKDAAPLLFEAFSRLETERVPLPAPPPYVLTGAGESLPLPLRHFMARGDANYLDPNRPEISFPPDGAEVDLGLSDARRGADLVLKLKGGAPPFSWIINGEAILPAQYDRQMLWPVESGGFMAVSVVDSLGRAARVRFFLQ